MPPGLRDVFLGLVLWILFVIIFENFFFIRLFNIRFSDFL